MSYTIDALQPSEISDLLDLQRANLKTNLDAQTIDSQGFVSFVYDVPTMQRMMAAAPQIIARTDDGTIVGYALSATVDFSLTNDLLRPLAELCLNFTPLSNLRFYFCGQVCVREGWRGQGIFDALYAGHRQFFKESYDCIVTEIADDNKRSLAAHKRVGFDTIHRYTEGDKDWHLVKMGFNQNE
jgi:RimJ/RimL family protein N-acetyltransferase